MDGSDPPEPSSVSVKSDRSMDLPPRIKEHTDLPLSPVQMDRSDPPEPSSVSVKSDRSMDLPPRIKEHTDLAFSPKQLHRSDPLESSSVSMKSDRSMELPPNHKMAHDFSPNSQHPKVLNTFRSSIQKKFECLYDGTANQRNPTLLNEIYTELYITESESGDVSNEHEVRQIETHSSRTATEDTPIKCSDIFKPSPAHDKPIKSVLTKGVAGIGKTVSVQKFILDWAEEKENKDVHLIFPLPFREINLMKDKTLSLSDLLHVFFPETQEIDISSDEYKVLFIFDGLDECRLSLDFHSSVRLCDVSESASVDVLLTNLIKGNLLPSALIWITSRPAATDLIPSECVDRVTEVRGFSDPQKEEYFRKRISDENLANRIISHVKSSRSVYIMCHIPVFCWISATVLERMLSEAESGEIPKTLTQMYTHFLIIQTNIKHQKDYVTTANDKDMVEKLGKLAFEQLVKGNLIFYEEDLRECSIDVAEASVYSGLCTQIFREEFGLYQGKVYSFVHLSVQEHLAALYVLFSFLLYKRDVLNEYLPSTYASEFTCHTISELHQRAVDKTLQSKNGNLDLFLRFLLGLSLESNQKLLQDLLTHTGNISWSKEDTVEYIKIRIRMNASPEKSINLFHSLYELGDQSLVTEVQNYVQSGHHSYTRFSSTQWSAMVFVLLTSEQLDVFNLSKYISRDNQHDMTSDGVLLKLLPVVEASRSAELFNCGLSETCCAGLASVLSSKSSCLRKMDLTDNKLGDSGVKLLSAGLQNPHCKLKTLRLSKCGIIADSCAALTSALRSNLTELDLTDNKLGDSGVKLLSAGLQNPQCKLENLVLWDCNITGDGCAALAAALSSNLRHLDLSKNHLADSGVELLSAGLGHPNCKLEKLRLSGCGVTGEGCAALAAALRSASHLTELNLSKNHLADSGVKLLCAGLEHPNCKLRKLVLWDCNIAGDGCAALAEGLRSNSHLTELDLSKNNLGDSGVELLSDGLKSQNCKLENLWLWDCKITGEGCAALAAALKSNSHLTELNLFKNELGNKGLELLSNIKRNPRYKLPTGYNDGLNGQFMDEW